MRAKLLAIAASLWVSPALAAGLTIDSSSVGSAKSASSVSSAPLTTHGPTDLVACSHAEWQNPGAATWDISTVTDTAGLTWSRRGKTVPMLGGRSGAWNGLGCWWANAPAALTSDIITMTWAPGPVFDGSTIVVIAVAGSANPASPFDPNTSLPATAMSSSSSAASVPVSGTNATGGLVLGIVAAGDFVGWSPGYVGSNFIGVNGIPSIGTSGWSSIAAEDKLVTTPQSNLPVNWVAQSNGWVSIADVFSAAAPSPPVNGLCGSANGVAVSVAPAANLCSSGTPSVVSGAGPWTWACSGSNGGTPAMCSAPLSSGPPQGPVNLQTGVTGILPVPNGGTGTASPGLIAGPNVTITGTWPNQTISGSGGGSPGGPLSMKIVQPPALNVITANQIQAAALDYMAITDAAAQVTAGPVPITVQAPGLADVQVWTHGQLNIHLTNNGSGTFTGTLDLSHEPSGPILVGYYGFDQVAPLIPGTELVGKYMLFVNGGSSPVPPFPAAAAGMTLAFADEFATLDVSPCVPGSYPCVPTSETATWYPNKGDGQDFGDAFFGHPGEVDNPFTVMNGFLRIRMTHCQPADNCIDHYNFGRTWKSGIIATTYPDGTTTFDGIRKPVLADGYYEAKILFPDGGSPDAAQTNGGLSGGTWGAWWMLTVNAAKCTTKIGACDPALMNGNDEFDIDEQYGKFPSWDTTGSHVYGTNIGTGEYTYHSQPSQDVPVLLPVKDFTWDFHRFGALIKNGVAQLYIDDVPLGKHTVLGVFPGTPTPVINWTMLINLALGGGWPEAAPPAQYYDQWIKDVRYFH